MIAHRDAVIDERSRREIFVIVRKPFLDRAPEQRLVVRGGDLIVVRQAGRVHVGGAAHAERMRLLRHQLGEARLRRRRGFRRSPPQRRSPTCVTTALIASSTAMRLAGLESEFRRRLLGGVLGDLERRIEPDLAGFEPLEQQIKRHDLGQRRRMARRVGVRRVQHLAGVAVDDDRGGRRRKAFGVSVMIGARRARRDDRVP